MVRSSLPATAKPCGEINRESISTFIPASLIILYISSLSPPYNSWFPVIAKNLGINEASIGLLTALFTIMGVFSAMLSGKYMKKTIGPKKTVALSFAVSGVIFVFMPNVVNIAQLLILQGVVGFFMGFILPIMMAQGLINIKKGMKDTAMGYLQAIYGFGVLGGPFITGIVVRYANIRIGYLVVTAVCLTGLLITYLYGKDDRKNGLAKY